MEIYELVYNSPLAWVQATGPSRTADIEPMLSIKKILAMRENNEV
jgi:L-lactate utilization protein LutC